MRRPFITAAVIVAGTGAVMGTIALATPSSPQLGPTVQAAEDSTTTVAITDPTTTVPDSTTTSTSAGSTTTTRPAGSVPITTLGQPGQPVSQAPTTTAPPPTTPAPCSVGYSGDNILGTHCPNTGTVKIQWWWSCANDPAASAGGCNFPITLSSGRTVTQTPTQIATQDRGVDPAPEWSTWPGSAPQDANCMTVYVPKYDLRLGSCS